MFLAVLLPLQLAWGAVSGYCQHESGVAAKHFGHHEHVHKGDPKEAAGLKVVPDSDCGTCHGTGPTVVVAPRAALPTLGASANPTANAPRAPPGLPPDTPERPQWPRLA